MKDRKRHILCSVLTTFVLAILFAALSVQASAASAGTTTLSAGKTYKSFDITGDGKTDTVAFRAKKGSYSYSSLQIYVNGKQAYSDSKLASYNVYEIKLELIRLKNGKPFLYLYAAGDNGDGPCMVLQYRGGKLQKIIDLATLLKGYGNHESGSVKSVSGNSVVFRVHLMSWELGGGLICNFTYKYKSGTLKRASYTAKIESVMGNRSYMTAARTIKAYKKPGGKSVKFKIKEGQQVFFPRAWLKGGKLWIEVKVNGKTGWIPAASKAYALYSWEKGKKPTFKEIMYAG